MANIEDLWKTLEVKKGKNLGFDYSDASFSPIDDNVENPFEENYDPNGSYDDPFEGEMGEFDQEVEVINRNGHVRREFSLSRYDVDVRPFQQYRNRVPVTMTLNTSSSEGQSSRDGRDSHDSIEELDEDEYLLEMEQMEENSNYGNSYDHATDFHLGHEIYDRLDNLKFRDERMMNVDSEGNLVEGQGRDPGHCQCEECVGQREATPVSPLTPPPREITPNSLHTSTREATPVYPITPPPREITCDCEDCLNHSGNTYICDCDNCRSVGHEEGEEFELKNNNNHPEDVCKCSECVGQSVQHTDDITVCTCEHCVREHELQVSNQESVHQSVLQQDGRSMDSSQWGMSQTFQPTSVHYRDQVRSNKGLSQTVQNFKPIETYNERYPMRKRDNSKLNSQKTKSSNGAANKSKAVTFNNLVIEKMGNVQYLSEELNGDFEISDETDTDGAIYNRDGHAHHTEEFCDYEDYLDADFMEDPEELLEDQLQTSERKLKQKTNEYEAELTDLKKENDKQNQIIQKNLSLGPDAKIEATMQYEISRLTSENLDLRETIDHQADQIRKLKKMLKVYAKKLKEGDAAEIQAELEKEETKSVENVAQVKHRDRNYMGMLEYKKEEEAALIKALVLELKPRVVSGMLPGLPAYLLFMCVRHTDYVNDDEKVRSLLTSTINGIKKVVKKHHDDLDRVTLWLANTCRFLHTLKQYSGEKQFLTENTPRQNEHCLRNFDLSEYRSVFSDLAVWIYQTLIKLMEATIQPSIVPAVLEHEAIAGLTGSKPSGLRGRSSSRAEDTPEYSLDSLMKSMNHFVRVLNQHAVDPELIKQIFRQLYYFLGASALNNLLLRKEMCNWSKGMQIRYNLSHMEQWLRDNKLQESGAGMTLEPIVQASQLLQARKTDADVDSVCDMCSKLTTSQIVKILNLYTPVDEFEERVPISFIRKIQQKLKGRENKDNALLMDLKFSYSVTFPFNPSKIALETIDIPNTLHLGPLLTRC